MTTETKTPETEVQETEKKAKKQPPKAKAKAEETKTEEVKAEVTEIDPAVAARIMSAVADEIAANPDSVAEDKPVDPVGKALEESVGESPITRLSKVLDAAGFVATFTPEAEAEAIAKAPTEEVFPDLVHLAANPEEPKVVEPKRRLAAQPDTKSQWAEITRLEARVKFLEDEASKNPRSASLLLAMRETSSKLNVARAGHGDSLIKDVRAVLVDSLTEAEIKGLEEEGPVVVINVDQDAYGALAAGSISVIGHRKSFDMAAFMRLNELVHQAYATRKVERQINLKSIERACPTPEAVIAHSRRIVENAVGNDLAVRILREVIVKRAVENDFIWGFVPVVMVGADKALAEATLGHSNVIELDVTDPAVIVDKLTAMMPQ